MARHKKEKRLKRFLGWGWKGLFRLLLIILCLTVFQVFLLRFVDPPFTVYIAWNWLQDKLGVKYYESPSFQWRPLNEISPHLKRAILASEDQRFLVHHGFDFIEMDQAIRDMFLGRKVRGASTITMQVARTVFLWPGRSWLRKMFEAYYTVLIEIFWTKGRIFEIYLNTVDWGQGIMGVEAAAIRYFHTQSSHITPSQGALLAAILPSPHRWSPTHPNEVVKARQKRIMRDMVKMPLL